MPRTFSTDRGGVPSLSLSREQRKTLAALAAQDGRPAGAVLRDLIDRAARELPQKEPSHAPQQPTN
jgi:hypothetical protein